MNPLQIIERGRNSEALLKSTTLNEAFETVLAKITREWLATARASGSRIEADDREALHARAFAITELRGQLTAWLNDAVAEQAKLDRAEKRKGVK